MALFRFRNQEKTPVEELEGLVSKDPYNIVSLTCKSLGINLEEFYNRVQETYSEALRSGNFSRMKLVRDITGVKLSNPLVSEIQSRYISYASRHEHDEIVELREASGVPIFDTAQNTYLKENLEVPVKSRFAIR